MPEMLRPASPPNPKKAASASKGQTPKTIHRGQNSDEPAARSSLPSSPAKLTMPTPEECGLVPSKPSAALDWAGARTRLDDLGATHYSLSKAAEGGFRFVCALPHPQDATKQRQFEAHASNETEAITAVLKQAEQWKQGRP